jgi:hypothetical protein
MRSARLLGGRADDPARRHRAVLVARHHRHDLHRGRSAIVSGYAGLVLSFQTKVPSGPAIILVAAGSMWLGAVRQRQRPGAADVSRPHLEA